MKNNQNQSSGQHGGTRSGAGRKAGTPNKKTKALLEAVQASGDTPLDVILDIMRWAHNEAGNLIQACHTALEAADADEKLKAYFEEGRHMKTLALDAATRAAPYVHARRVPTEKPDQGSGADDIEKPKAPDPHRLAEIAARYSKHGLKSIKGGRRV